MLGLWICVLSRTGRVTPTSGSTCSVVIATILAMHFAGMALVLGLRHAGVIVPPDPLFLIVLLLAHSTPTAINMQTVATMHQNGEAEMSCMLCARHPCLLAFP